MASFLKKIGKGLKKVGKGLGKIGGIAAPILAATGVGMPLAIGIGAASGALRGGKPKEWLKRAAIGGGTAALGGMAGKMLGTSGIAKSGGGWLGKVRAAGGALKSAGGKLAASNLPGKIMGGGGGMMPGGAPGAPGGGGMSLADLAQLGMAGYGMYQGNRDLGRQRAIDDQMMQRANTEWSAGAPMRDEARRMAMGGGGMPGGGMGYGPPPSIFRDPNNPFAR